MQKCPNCGRTTVRTKDWACQWCGYPLLSGSYRKIPKTYKQLKTEKLYKQESPVREETTIEVTVEEVYSAYSVDKVLADAKFRNKILKVTGVVDRIVVEDLYDVYYINLASAEKKDGWNVRCMFDKKHGPELNRLTAGQTVTVQGKYNGYEINILIRDCVLVR